MLQGLYLLLVSKKASNILWLEGQQLDFADPALHGARGCLCCCHQQAQETGYILL